MAVLSEALTQILIPAAALIGVGFALLQWLLVSKVKVSADYGKKDGYKDKLIEDEEEGAEDVDAFIKCSEIQNAISVGNELSLSLSLSQNK